jgi:hypothetical protein
MIALIALIAVGFGMATLGIALMFLGEVPFIAGKRIPALRARLIGLTLVAFLPLVAGARTFVNFALPDTVDPQALAWSIFGFLWVVVCVILFRVMVPKREARKPAKGAMSSTSKSPFGEPEPAKVEAMNNGEAKKPRAQKKAPEPAPESLAWMEPEPEPAPAPVTKKPPEPAKKSAGKKRPKPAAEDNPFDFS